MEIGPFEVHAYGLLFAVAVVVAVLITRRRWDGDPQLVDEVALWGFPAGLIGGRLYHVITSWDEVHHTWWGLRGLERGAGDLGRDRVRRGRGLWRVGGPAPTRGRSWTPARPRCSSRRRSGASATTSTRSCSAGRQPAVGAGDRPRAPARGVPHAETFHPTFLYEIVLDLGARGVPGLARPPPPDPAARPVRAVRRGLLASGLRGRCGSTRPSTSSGSGSICSWPCSLTAVRHRVVRAPCSGTAEGAERTSRPLLTLWSEAARRVSRRCTV